MKPISLEISAFGPYKNKEVVDFEKIGQNGIFLITGDTGAGKTTIFDAIMYALYGSVSGSNRQITTVRSDFATPDVKTYVKFKFSHKGKIYTITRNPEYERLKISGVGTTKQSAEANIFCGDDLLASGIKNVDEKVIQIFSIDEKQFKQISMLAQGEFLKILFADSKQRTEIFRKIFDTNIYNDIRKKLEEKKKEAFGAFATNKTKFFTNTSNIKWKNAPEFINILNDDNIGNYLLDVIELLEIEVSDNEKEKKDIKKNIDNLEKEVKDLEQKIQKAQEINKKFERIADIEEKQKVHESQKDEYENKKQIINKNNLIKLEILPKANELNKTKLNIKNVENDITNIQENIIQVNRINEEYDEKNIKIKELKNVYDKYTNTKINIEMYEKEINNIEIVEKSIKERNDTELIFENLKKKENYVIELKEKVEIYNKDKEELKNITEEKNKILEIEKHIQEREFISKNNDDFIKQYRELEDLCKYEEDKFYKEQAGILAEGLEEGMPCPVCGSKNHPIIAKKSGALTKEELEKLQKKLKDKEKEKNKKNEELTIKNSQIDTLSSKLQNNNSLNLIEYKETIIEKYKTINEKINKDLEQANELHINITSKEIEIELFDYDILKKEFDDNLKSIEKKITEKETIIDNFKNNMVKSLSDKKQMEEYIKDVREKYNLIKDEKNKNEDSIIGIYKDLENKILDVENFEFEEYREQYDKKKNEHFTKATEYKTKKIEYDKLLLKYIKECEKIEEEYKNSYVKLGFESEESYMKIMITESDLEDYNNKIKEYEKNEIELVTQLKELKESVDGKEKILLEGYIERKVNLDEVLEKNREIQLNITAIYSKNKDILESLLESKNEINCTKEEFETLNELYQIASGTMPGKRRIEFEQYVQATYFDMILVEANKRLVKMTGNRYELIRKESSARLNDRIGLDLEVIDNYTGKKRDVKSLSGGESFKAALSLSLGVSDVIQSYSGGVVVDTLFIDEGFGSLDVESREQAIETLNLLTTGDKLIGIISHVTELKERIEKKLIIEKSSEGSKVRIEI